MGIFIGFSLVWLVGELIWFARCGGTREGQTAGNRECRKNLPPEVPVPEETSVPAPSGDSKRLLHVLSLFFLRIVCAAGLGISLVRSAGIRQEAPPEVYALILLLIVGVMALGKLTMGARRKADPRTLLREAAVGLVLSLCCGAAALYCAGLP